jgi:hypothetical protein
MGKHLLRYFMVTPRYFGISADTHCTYGDLREWLKERASMSAVIQQNLLRAQQRMKAHADKYRREREREREREFEVGDWFI